MNRPEKMGAAEAAPCAMPRPTERCVASPRQALLGHALPPQCSDPSAYHRKLARLLDRMGGVYLLDDILTAISEGRMQSFVEGNSWAITKIADFPRARQLELIAYVGDLADVDALHAKILAYADEVNAGLLSTYGRLGWLREGSFERLGWRLKAKSQLYLKEL